MAGVWDLRGQQGVKGVGVSGAGRGCGSFGASRACREYWGHCRW